MMKGGWTMKRLLLVIILLLLSGCEMRQATAPNENEDRLKMYAKRIEILSRTSPMKSDDFRARWNSINETMGHELMLPAFQLQQTSDYNYFSISFTSYLDMKVTFNKTHQLRSITITGTPTNKRERFHLLNSWVQTMMTTRPELDNATISELFHRFGVDVNGDLSELDRTSIVANNATYEIRRDGQQIVFIFKEN
jgi:hypothetical protein